MSTRSIIIVEYEAVPALTWMMFWNSFTVDSWSVAIVIVATVAPILMFFPDHCFTRCQECQQGEIKNQRRRWRIFALTLTYTSNRICIVWPEV